MTRSPVPREMWVATAVCIVLSFALGGFVWAVEALSRWVMSW